MDYTQIELILKIIGIVTGYIFTYHKFIVKLIDKKVDKALYDSDIKHINELRYEDNKTLFNKIESLEDSIKDLNKNLIEIFLNKKVE